MVEPRHFCLLALGFVVASSSTLVATNACTPFSASAASGIDVGDAGVGNDAMGVDPDAANAPALPHVVGVAFADQSGGVSMRNFDNGSWSPVTSIVSGNIDASEIRYVAARVAPKSAEMLIGVQNADTSQSFFLRDATGAITLAAPASGTALQAGRRAFDAAYRSRSGEAVVVYSTNENGFADLRATGGEWGGSRSYVGTARVEWVELTAAPQSDELALVFSDANADLWAAVLPNGATSWSTSTKIASGLNHVEFKSFAAAYDKDESLVVCWGENNGNSRSATRLKNGDFGASVLIHDKAASPMLLTGDNANRDRLLWASLELSGCGGGGCEDLVVNEWSAAAWKKTSQPFDAVNEALGDSYGTRPGASPLALAWTGKQSAIMTYYSADKGFRWAKWAPNVGWEDQSPFGMTPAQGKISMQARSLPNNDGALVVMSTEISELWAMRFDGTMWTDAGADAIAKLRVTDNVPFDLYVR